MILLLCLWIVFSIWFLHKLVLKSNLSRQIMLTVACCCSSCCCLFFMSCSADLRSSSVTPWVERRVERTILAWAFLCVSLSSSRLGGMNDLDECTKLHVRSYSAPTALCSTTANHLTDWLSLTPHTTNTQLMLSVLTPANIHSWLNTTKWHLILY